MTSTTDRITQFENMAKEDPDNDMAHFSLGNAYLQAGRPQDAAVSLQACIQINPDMSKAYQLAGQALIETDEKDAAAKVLKRGYEIASSRGDVMPRDAIAQLLESIGQELPEVAVAETAQPPSEDDGSDFTCKATGRRSKQLSEPPMRGKLGQWIYDNIGEETWKQWIAQGTKVINELRLDFSKVEDQKVYDQYMCEFLGIDEELHSQLTQEKES